MQPFPEATVLTPEQIRVGLSAQFEREITNEDVLTFAANSGDANPLHTDKEYAGQSNFHGGIVHGAFQISLASALAGMHLPGRNVLLGSVQARFPSPLYYPCRVRVHGQIVSWNPATRAGNLKVIVCELNSQIPTADIFMGFTLHEQRPVQIGALPTAIPSASLSNDGGGKTAKVIVVTGASGGLGSSIIPDLAKHFDVIALAHRNSIQDQILRISNVSAVQTDLQMPGWENELTKTLGNRPLYGIVHTAWPSKPHGGLLECDNGVLTQQLVFGTFPIALCRFLINHAGETGGRCVVLGSYPGSLAASLSCASYFLAKLTLENTVRLLAPELARKKITINVVSPSFLHLGMNKQSGDRQILKETAAIPMGRLCQPEDIIGLLRYLLSPESAFVSGQVISLTGAQIR
jgi:NAD(P)-dependent dehydrogenase (short-subunit alcohol dehydrogenase family)/acyl dehydratase